MFSADDMLMVKTIQDHGSLTAAAEALYTSQPALSRSLNNLETRIGARLFKRVPRGMTPTACGLTLLQYADQVQAITHAARVQVDAQVRRNAPLLRLGIAPYVSLTPVTRAIAAMAVEHPALHFEVLVGAPDSLIETLSAGGVDLVIGPLTQNERHLKQTPLFEDVFAVIVRQAHPIKARRPSLAALTEHRWVLPGLGHPLRQRVDALFMDAGLPAPQVFIETEDVPLAFNLALSSDLLVAIPKDVALFTRRDQHIRLLDMQLPGAHAGVGITQLRARRLLPEADSLIDAVSREIKRARV